MVFKLFSGDCLGGIIVFSHVRHKFTELSVCHLGVTTFGRHGEEVSRADCNATFFVSESLLDVVNILHMFVFNNIKSGVGISCRSE
jgi:hypothetical protein